MLNISGTEAADLLAEDPENEGLTTTSGPRPSRTEVISLWEEKWNQQALLRHWKKMNKRAVARGFRQVAVSDDQLFIDPEAVDRCRDKDHVVLAELEKKSVFVKMRRFGGNDIAGGDSLNSAYWVLVVIGIDPKTKHRYILHIRRDKGLSVGRQFDIMSEVYDLMNWETCGVESNGVQAAIERHYKEAGLFPTKPIHTGSLQKNDEDVGIPAMFSEFEAGLWHIPWGNTKSRRDMDPLINELKAYPTGRFSDCVMALYFANQMWLQAPKNRIRVEWV